MLLHLQGQIGRDLLCTTLMYIWGQICIYADVLLRACVSLVTYQAFEEALRCDGHIKVDGM